jgi:hypothetical protein
LNAVFDADSEYVICFAFSLSTIKQNKKENKMGIFQGQYLAVLMRYDTWFYILIQKTRKVYKIVDGY